MKNAKFVKCLVIGSRSYRTVRGATEAMAVDMSYRLIESYKWKCMENLIPGVDKYDWMYKQDVIAAKAARRIKPIIKNALR